MVRKKKVPTIRMTVKLTAADEQALRSVAATIDRDANWVLGKLCHLAVGTIDTSVEIRRWLRGDTAWDAGLSGDQQPLCVIENGDPPVVRAPRRQTVAQNPPTLEEVEAYVKAQGYGFLPEDFHSFYSANGWVQGRTSKPLLDWKAAAKNWQISFLQRNPAAKAASDWGAHRPAEPEPSPEPEDDRTAELPLEEGEYSPDVVDGDDEEAGA